MDFSDDSSLQLLQDGLSNFLRRNYGAEARRTALLSPPGWRPQLWRNMLTELDLGRAALPAARGGLGGAPEICVVMEALGQFLVVEPYLETAVLAGSLLARIDTPLARDTLRDLLAADAVVTVAMDEPLMRHDLRATACRADACDDGWRINGRKCLVVAAPWASHFLLAARSGGQPGDGEGLSLFLAPRQAQGVRPECYPTIDGRRAADLVLEDVVLPRQALLGAPGRALPLLEWVWDLGAMASCAEALGVIDRLLAETLEYTRTRRQFGQPLSGFQALRHRMVDMHLQAEMARAALLPASRSLDLPPPQRAQAVSAAKAIVAEACRFVSQNAVQLHGGIGTTDDCIVSHYFRRAAFLEHRFGNADWHLARHAALERQGVAA